MVGAPDKGACAPRQRPGGVFALSGGHAGAAHSAAARTGFCARHRPGCIFALGGGRAGAAHSAAAALSGQISISVRHAAGPLRPAQQAWVCAYRSLWLVVRCFMLSPYRTDLCSPFSPAAWEEASEVCCAHIDVLGAEAPYLVSCVAFRWIPQLWLSFSLARIVFSLSCELSSFFWLCRGDAGLHPNGQILVCGSRAVRAPSFAVVELQHFICACVLSLINLGL